MEVEFSKTVMNRLKPYFDVEAEVWSKSGKSRIDFVIRDKEHGKYFGVEFKDLEDNKRGVGLGEHIIQSMRYAVSEFKTADGYKRLPILICPPISYNHLQAPLKESMKKMMGFYGQTQEREYFHDKHDKNHTHHTVNGLLGSFGLGEIRTSISERHGQFIYFSFSNRMIWDGRPKWNNDLRKYEGVNGIHLKHYEFQINKQLNYSMK